MNDEAGFLKAIADQPAERSTRLVYADWLDEHDRPREAEFLRLQIQVAEMSERLFDLGDAIGVAWLTAVGNLRLKPEWLKLRSGRTILLRNFRQWHFYEGLMAGVPTSEGNRMSLDHLVDSERERQRQEPYVIPPVETPIQRPTSDWPDWNEPRGMYPSIVCVGQFRDFRAVKDKGSDGSDLTVIWFQPEWAFPIDPGVREQIRAIDWEKHAHDFYW